MLRAIPIALAVVFIISLGVVQGIWSDRWAEPGIDAEEFAARLADVPMKIGDWEGEDRPQDAALLRGAGAVGSVSRVYSNVRTGDQVSVFIICGHSRDVAGHTPEECYPAAGMPKKGDTKTHNLEDTGDAFHTAVFHKESYEEVQSIRIFWSWLSEQDESWQAPENAKLHYGGVRALYKVYLINTSNGQSMPSSPSLQFARELMPTLTKALHPPVLERVSEEAPTAQQETAPNKT